MSGPQVLRNISAYEKHAAEHSKNNAVRKVALAIMYEEMTHMTPLEPLTDDLSALFGKGTLGPMQVSPERHSERLGISPESILNDESQNILAGVTYLNELQEVVESRLRRSIGEDPATYQLLGSYYNADAETVEQGSTEYGKRIADTADLVDRAIRLLSSTNQNENEDDGRVSRKVRELAEELNDTIIRRDSVKLKNIEANERRDRQENGIPKNEAMGPNFLDTDMKESSANPRSERLDGDHMVPRVEFENNSDTSPTAGGNLPVHKESNREDAELIRKH